MAEIDPVEFGRLLQSVETLNDRLAQTGRLVETLNERMGEIESRYRFGKGAFFGLCIGASFAIFGFAETARWLWSKFAG